MSLAGHAGVEGRCLSSDTYLAKLLQGLQHLRSQNALCDVTLEAGGLSFPAHKAVLASASSYCKMRFGGVGAGPDAPLQLAGVTAGGLRNVLAFVYSNRLELTLRTVEETLAAAEALLVREVVRLCFQFLEEALDGHTCLEVLRIAKRLGPEELRQKARRCVGRHCGEILADLPRLRGLDRETLCEILEGAGAEAPSERELFRAAVRWLRHDPTRGKDAAEILRRLRLPLVPSQELQEFGREMAPTEMEPACRQYFQEALDYHARLYAQPALQSERTQVRAGADTLLVLGGRTADNVVCADIWAADQSSRSWEKLGDLPGPLYNHCVAVIHDFLFVMGGQDRFDPTGQCPSNKVFRLDPRHDTWLQVASMLERRTRFHAGVLNDRLVAVGGGALLGVLSAAAEEYQPAENEWRPIVSFPVPVADHAGATHKGIFYVSGGFTASRTLRDAYSYLSRLRCWIKNRPMTFARCDHGMATVGDRLFCVGGRALNHAEDWVPVNETEAYCPAADQWTVLTPSPFDRCQFGLAVHQQQLYITGGGSLRRREKEDGVFICSPSGKAWQKVGALPKALVDHSCCSVRLSRRILAKPQQKAMEAPATGKKTSTLTLFVTNKHNPQPALLGTAGEVGSNPSGSSQHKPC